MTKPTIYLPWPNSFGVLSLSPTSKCQRWPWHLSTLKNCAISFPNSPLVCPPLLVPSIPSDTIVLTLSSGLPCTRHRVFLAVLICAAKYCNDSSPKNVHWQKYGRFFSLPEVNLMERQLLFLLDWDLSVSEEQIIHRLKPFWAGPGQTSTSTPITPVVVAPLVPAVSTRVAAPPLPTMSSMPSIRTAPIRPGGSFSAQQHQPSLPLPSRRPSSMSVPASSPAHPSPTADANMVSNIQRRGMDYTPGLMSRKASTDSLASTVSGASGLVSPSRNTYYRSNSNGHIVVQMHRSASGMSLSAGNDNAMIVDTDEREASPRPFKVTRIEPIVRLKVATAKKGYFGLGRMPWHAPSPSPIHD